MSRTTDRVSTKSAWRTGNKKQPYGVKACRNFKQKSNARRER